MYALQQIINGATSSGPLVLVSLALTVTLGYLRALNVALGTVLTLTAFFTTRVAQHSGSVALVFLAAVLGGAAITVLMELFLLRPMRGRTGDLELGSFIATFAISLAGIAVVQSATGSQVISFPESFPELDKVTHVGSIDVHLLNLVSVVVAIVLGIGLMVFLRASSSGRSLRALAADWEGGQLVGIRVGQVALLVAVIAGLLTGLAGFVSGVQARGMNFLTGQDSLLLAFAVIVVGGVGSVGGAIVVGVLVGAVNSLLGAEVSSQFSEAMVFALLFIVLIIRPEGFGRIGPRRQAAPAGRLARLSSALRPSRDAGDLGGADLGGPDLGGAAEEGGPR